MQEVNRIKLNKRIKFRLIIGKILLGQIILPINVYVMKYMSQIIDG